MENWIASLLKLGRPGGALSILAAVGIIVVVVLDYMATGAFFLALPPLALALFVMGIALMVWGGEGRELKIKDDDPPPADLVRRLYVEERPFHVCTRCRWVKARCATSVAPGPTACSSMTRMTSRWP